MSKTHYETLGLQPNCTLEDIKKAYKSLIKSAHTDKSGIDTTALAQEITNAYQVLSDPAKRKQYDYSLKETAKTDTFQCGDPTSHAGNHNPNSREVVIAPIHSLEKIIKEANMSDEELKKLAKNDAGIAKFIFTKTLEELKLLTPISKVSDKKWGLLINIAETYEALAINLIQDNVLVNDCLTNNHPGRIITLARAHLPVAIHVLKSPAIHKKLEANELLSIYTVHKLFDVEIENSELADRLKARHLLINYLRSLQSNATTFDLNTFYNLLQEAGHESSKFLADYARQYPNLATEITRHEKLFNLLCRTDRYFYALALANTTFAQYLVKNKRSILSQYELQALGYPVEIAPNANSSDSKLKKTSLPPQTPWHETNLDVAYKRLENCKDSNYPEFTADCNMIVPNISETIITQKLKNSPDLIFSDKKLRERLATDSEKKADPDCFDTYKLYLIAKKNADLALRLLRENKQPLHGKYYIGLSQDIALYILNHPRLLTNCLESYNEYLTDASRYPEVALLILKTPAARALLTGNDLYKVITNAEFAGAQLALSDITLSETLSGEQLFELSKKYGLPIIHLEHLKKVRAYHLLTTAASQPKGMNIAQKSVSEIKEESEKDIYFDIANAYAAYHSIQSQECAEMYYFKAAYLGHAGALEKLTTFPTRSNIAIFNLKLAEVCSNKTFDIYDQARAASFVQKVVDNTTVDNHGHLLKYISKCIDDLELENIDLANLYLFTLDKLNESFNFPEKFLEGFYRIAAKTIERSDKAIALRYLEKIPPEKITAAEYCHMATLASDILYQKQLALLTANPRSPDLITADMNASERTVERILVALPYYFKAAAKKDEAAINLLKNNLAELFSKVKASESDELISKFLQENAFVLNDTFLIEKLIPYIKLENTFLQLTLDSRQAHEYASKSTVKLLLESASLRQFNICYSLLTCLQLANTLSTKTINNDELTPELFAFTAIESLIHRKDYQQVNLLNKILSFNTFYSTIASEFLSAIASHDNRQEKIGAVTAKCTRLERISAENAAQTQLLAGFFNDLNSYEATLKMPAKKKIVQSLTAELRATLSDYYNQDFSSDTASTREKLQKDCIAAITKHLATPNDDLKSLADWKIRQAFKIICLLQKFKIFRDSERVKSWYTSTSALFCVSREKSVEFTQKMNRVFSS